MPRTVSSAALADLWRRVAHLEHGRAAARPALLFGVPAINQGLPGTGLALGALHGVGGGGHGAIDGAAAALFMAGIAAQTRGPVLWCVTRAELGPRRVEAARHA
jgi:protein ImuA